MVVKHNHLYYNFCMDNKHVGGQKKNRSKLVLIAVFIVILLATGLVAFGIMFGRLVITIKEQNQTVALRTIVCNDDLISRYNTANQSVSEDYGNNIKPIVDEIEALPSHDKDPNCSFILFNYYYFKADAIKTRQYANQIVDQNNAGVSISGKIINPISTQQIEDYTRSLETNSLNNNGVGSG